MGRSYSYILFDLDGTLTDSGPGIMNGFSYVIRKMGGDVGDRGSLRRFIGPPLKDSFGRILGYSPTETEEAIRLYREYYDKMGGAFENSVYPGIEGLLRELKDDGKHLFVATSKSARAANTVLEHFNLKSFFDLIVAADDQERQTKADVIRFILERSGVSEKSGAVMVGDRENDILAAKEAGIDSIGVLYGYGSYEELTAAGATCMAESAEEIRHLVG